MPLLLCREDAEDWSPVSSHVGDLSVGRGSDAAHGVLLDRPHPVDACQLRGCFARLCEQSAPFTSVTFGALRPIRAGGSREPERPREAWRQVQEIAPRTAGERPLRVSLPARIDEDPAGRGSASAAQVAGPPSGNEAESRGLVLEMAEALDGDWLVSIGNWAPPRPVDLSVEARVLAACSGQ